MKKDDSFSCFFRNKTKSVLSSFKDTETLDLKILFEKLEARFGEHLG